jgi:hypothetical protein
MIAPFAVIGFAGHHEEAGGVVAGILNIAGQYVETVDFRCQFGGERADSLVLTFGHIAGGFGIVGTDPAPDPVFAQEARALRQDHDMAERLFHTSQLRALLGQKVDMDPHEGLINDMQSAFGQQRMHIRHPPIGGVFDSDHPKLGIAFAHGLDRGGEGGAGERVIIRPGIGTGLMTICP